MSLPSSSGIYSVPKLTESNWVDFKQRTISSLNARGLHRHLTGTVCVLAPLPVSTDSPPTIFKQDGKTKATDEDIEENLNLIDQYVQKGALAIQQFHTTIPNTIMIQVQSKSTVVEMWKAICEIHEAKSDMIQADTCACLQNLKCGEKDDVKIHTYPIC